MANQKITQFTEATSFSADTDLIPIVINTDTTPANRKMTKANFEAAVTSSFALLAATASYVEDSEKYTDTEISSAQILDLHNTPVTLIPEPTDGSFSYPSKVFIKYIFNTTAYTQAASNNIQVRVAGYTGAVLGEQFNSTTIDSTADYQKIKYYTNS